MKRQRPRKSQKEGQYLWCLGDCNYHSLLLWCVSNIFRARKNPYREPEEAIQLGGLPYLLEALLVLLAFLLALPGLLAYISIYLEVGVLAQESPERSRSLSLRPGRSGGSQAWGAGDWGDCFCVYVMSRVPQGMPEL